MPENTEVTLAELKKDVSTILRRIDEATSTFATKEALQRTTDNQKYLADQFARMEKMIDKINENMFRLFLALLGTATGFGLWMLQQFLTNKV